MPKQYSIVIFDFSNIEDCNHSYYPFQHTARYIFFGEIPNMPGHCVVADYKTGQIFAGYHTDHFIELSENAT